MDGGRGRFLGWCLQDEDTLWKKSWLKEEELLGGLAGVWCGECSGFVLLSPFALGLSRIAPPGAGEILCWPEFAPILQEVLGDARCAVNSVGSSVVCAMVQFLF